MNNPFSKLKDLRADLPPGKPPASRPAPKGPERAVVRMERAGRNGKEVTVIEQLGLPEKERLAWLKALKQTLGCGGALEDGNLVVQGDHRDRVKAWLEKRGVRRISVG